VGGNVTEKSAHFAVGRPQVLPAAVLLAAALLSALMGLAARRYDRPVLAAVFSLAAIALAGVVVLGVGPRLLRWVAPEAWTEGFWDRLTSRGFAFLLVLVGVTMLVIHSGNNLWILILSLLLSVFLVSGLISHLVLHGLEVEVQYPERVHAGQTMVLLLRVVNRKRRMGSFGLGIQPRLRLGDQDPAVEEKTLVYVGPGHETVLRWEIPLKRRGIYPFEGILVSTSFPFGFVRRGRLIDEPGAVVVYPALADLRGSKGLPPTMIGVIERLLRGQGGSLYNVRDYVWGDDARFMHWKATAKLERPMIREFTEERVPELHLVFSTWLPDREAPEMKERFETAVSWAATAVIRWWEQRVHFSFDSGEFRGEVNGNGNDLEQVLEYLAAVTPSDRLLVDEKQLVRGTIYLAGHRASRRDGVVVVEYGWN